MTKTNQVTEHVRKNEWREALRIAKTFRYSFSHQERQDVITAHECLVYPEFYRGLKMDPTHEVEKGKAVLMKHYGEPA